MNNLIGYHIYSFKGQMLTGGGAAYDYALAGNGVFIRAENSRLWAMIPIAEASVRGLPPLEAKINLRRGRIPQRFWDLALSIFLASPEVERYAGIRWAGASYQLYVPEQEGGPAHLTYRVAEDVVVELHSHPDFGPGFSPTDNDDEKGFKIYGIVGELNEEKPSVNLRVGVYGYYHPAAWREVFEGEHTGVIDINEPEGKEE